MNSDVNDDFFIPTDVERSSSIASLAIFKSLSQMYNSPEAPING